MKAYIHFTIILLGMKNVSDKSCREKSRHIFHVQLLFSENCALYKTMWENLVKSVMPQITI